VVVGNNLVCLRHSAGLTSTCPALALIDASLDPRLISIRHGEVDDAAEAVSSRGLNSSLALGSRRLACSTSLALELVLGDRDGPYV
jgi:hypothetical protein